MSSAQQEFSVEWIQDNSVTDFDLYTKVAEHMIVYGSRGYKWYRRELSDLMSNGIEVFYHSDGDQSRVDTYKNLTKLPALEKNLEPKSRIISLQDVGAEFTKCLYSGEITPSCQAKGEEISTAIVECLNEDPTSIQSISGLADRDYYTYSHSVRVSSFIVAIAKKLGMTSNEKLTELAIGGMFHDIGKKSVPIELLQKAGVLTDSEWKLMRSHPEKGQNAMKESKLTLVQKEIILHHHEKLDGSGYPHALERSSLLPEVQIATVADIFDALSSSRSYQQKRSRYEALDFMKHKLLGSELDSEIFQALVSCLVED